MKAQRASTRFRRRVVKSSADAKERSDSPKGRRGGNGASASYSDDVGGV
jgi:hypothetical protein